MDRNEIMEMLAGLVARPDASSTYAPRYLNGKTATLAAVGAAVSLDADHATYEGLVSHALEQGATPDEVFGAFLAVASTVTAVTVVRAAPRISLALGYDVEEALESR